MDKANTDSLLDFAELFRTTMHAEICEHGGATLYEYDALWHKFKDDVLPILERERPNNEQA